MPKPSDRWEIVEYPHSQKPKYPKIKLQLFLGAKHDMPKPSNPWGIVEVRRSPEHENFKIALQKFLNTKHNHVWPGMATVLRKFINVDFFNLNDLESFTKRLDNLLKDEEFKQYRQKGPYKNMLDDFVSSCEGKIKEAKAGVRPLIQAQTTPAALKDNPAVTAAAVAKTSKDAKGVLPKEGVTGSYTVANLLNLLFNAPSPEGVRNSLHGDFSGLPGTNATVRYVN